MKVTAMLRTIVLTAAIAGLWPALAQAEVELSFYGGVQSAPHSDVFISGDPMGYPAKTRVKWEGKSFDMPPYYGLRATWWSSDSFGYGVDFTHTKVYADAASRGTDFTTLEFTDGLNTLTANAYRRFQPVAGITPYVGAGIGLAIPHVEVSNGVTKTEEYQITGPAATLLAGASYPVSDRLSVFGEYKFTYSQNEADLDGGGTLNTDIITNAVNVGLSFSF